MNSLAGSKPRPAFHPEEAEEGFKTTSKPRGPKDKSESVLHSLARMPWGGFITVNGQRVHIKNTCFFDHVVFLAYATYKTNIIVRDFFQNMAALGEQNAKLFLRVFRSLDGPNYEDARTTVATKLLQAMKIEDFDFFRSEEFVMTKLTTLLRVVENRACPQPSCNAPKSHEIHLGIDIWDLENPDSLPLFLNNYKLETCVGTLHGSRDGKEGEKCTEEVRITYSFPGIPRR